MRINVRLSVDVDGVELLEVSGDRRQLWSKVLASMEEHVLKLLGAERTITNQAALVMLRAFRRAVLETLAFYDRPCA